LEPEGTPERNAAEFVKPDTKGTRKLRDLGFTSALVVPGRGIFRGSSALINLTDSDTNTSVVSANVAQHIAFDFSRGQRSTYPASLMGAIALIRQSFLDGAWYQAAQDTYRKSPPQPSGQKKTPALPRSPSTRNANSRQSSRRKMSSIGCALCGLRRSSS
jgi:hypothetical protein